jgi:hypothetical protein
MDYAETIDQIAAQGQVIVSRSPDHAKAILRHLFRMATVRVRILSSTLDQNLFDNTVGDVAAGFLIENQHSSITILTDSTIDTTTHPFFNVPRRDGVLSRIGLWLVPPEIQRTYHFNFTVADGKHFRFEKDRKLLNAVVQFGNGDAGRSLDRVFCQLKSASIPATIV